MIKFKKDQLVGMNQHYRRYPYEMYLDSMCSCGIQHLEMWCGAPHFMLDPYGFSNPDTFEHEARARGLSYVSLCAPSMQWQHQYGAVKGERQKLAAAYYKNGVQVAAALGCKMISINAGWGFEGEPYNDIVKRSIETVSNVADFAQAQGITLALETLQPIESNIVLTLEQAAAYYQELNHPAVKMMIDTVAIGVAGETVEQWFQTFGENIQHCHLVDGAPSGHRVFGDGEFSLQEILHAFATNEYTGYFTMELGGVYQEDPFRAERRNMQVLGHYFD